MVPGPLDLARTFWVIWVIPSGVQGAPYGVPGVGTGIICMQGKHVSAILSQWFSSDFEFGSGRGRDLE